MSGQVRDHQIWRETEALSPAHVRFRFIRIESTRDPNRAAVRFVIKRNDHWTETAGGRLSYISYKRLRERFELLSPPPPSGEGGK